MRCYKKLLMSTLLLLLLIFSWVSSPSSSRFISRKRRRTSGIQPQWDFSSSKHEHLSKLWALFRLHITFPMINQRGVTRDVNVTCSKQRQSYCKCVICSNNLFSNSDSWKRFFSRSQSRAAQGHFRRSQVLFWPVRWNKLMSIRFKHHLIVGCVNFLVPHSSYIKTSMMLPRHQTKKSVNKFDSIEVSSLL